MILTPFPFVLALGICTEADPDFSYLRYSQKIPYCERNVSYDRKNLVYKKYGHDLFNRKRFTIDHIIPLFAGGTNHEANLFPELRLVRDWRYALEQDLYLALNRNCLTRDLIIQVIIESKFDPEFLAKPHYKSYGGLPNYISKRAKFASNFWRCTEWRGWGE